MAKFVIKASEFKNVCKAVNDRKLAELKKEIIEILKKQEEREVKKAVEFFEAQEAHYTHLEKSTLSGKWVEKAGYGIGTVRVWKGKKYKKIAPGKWARMYEKEGRGANVAVGRLIAQVNKIDNVEDLMNFAMMHKQRFVDENGMDLPILDKLRAAIDAKNGTVESKGTSKPAVKVSKIDQAVSDLQTLDWSESDGSDVKDIVNRYFKTDKEKAKFADYVKNESKFNKFQKDMLAEAVSGEKKDTFEDEMNRLNDAQEAAWEGFESGSEIKATPENSKKFYDKVKKFVDENNIKLTKKHHDEIAENNGHSFNEALALAGAYGEEEKKKALEWNKETNKKYKGAALDLSQIDEFKETGTEEKETPSDGGDTKKDEKPDEPAKETEPKEKPVDIRESRIKGLKDQVEWYAGVADENGKLSKEQVKGLEEVLENLYVFGNRVIDNDFLRGVKALEENGGKFSDEEISKKAKESEAEKHQNRSDAMKGNKNAYKGGLAKDTVKFVKEVKGEPYHDFETDANKLAIYSDDGRRSSGIVMSQEIADIIDSHNEPSILDWKDNIADEINAKYPAIQKDYVRLALGGIRPGYRSGKKENVKVVSEAEKESEAEKTKNRSDAMKGNKNAYKGMSYEELVKRRESFQRNGNRSEYFEGMSKEERDNSLDEMFEELDKRNLRNVDSDSFNNKNKEPKKTSGAKTQFKRELPAGSAKTVKENIGTFTKAGDGKVEMPATKEVAELFDSLNKSASKEENRHFMTDAYYDGENFVSTDGRRLVCIKAGDIGLDKGYVKVDTSGGKITVTALPEKKDYEFPNYKRVMPGSANTQEVKFDNKALKEKLKEMKKDGAFNQKSSTGVAIEFKDGKAYLDGTVVGSGDVKFPEGQEPFIKLNGFYLMDAALAGDSSSMFLDKDNPAHRATDISTNNSDIVIMTMEPVRSDYESGRKAKADKKAAKDKAKAENRKNNEKLLANFEPTKVDRNVENVASDIDSKLSEFSDDDLKENYDRLTIDFDKVMEKPGLMSLYSKVNKNGLSFGNAYLYSQLAKKHPEIKEKFEAEMKKRGLEVKKSLFDGFLVAELLEEDVDEEEEDEEEESLWNDYSAEQPELFNSTELMVREALNRRRCL